MKKKIAVVGAGISGIFSAWYAAKKGNQVEIFETSALPGGVLRENIVNHDLYSSGIQYLNNNENSIVDMIGKIIYIYKFNYLIFFYFIS